MKIRRKASFYSALVSVLIIDFALAGIGAFAEDVKVVQNLNVYLSATETIANTDSPFFYPVTKAETTLGSYSSANYDIRFQKRDVSAAVLASASAGASNTFSLNVSQAWCRFNLGEGWGIAFGRRDLKWRDGGYWNPSDIVNNKLSWGETGQATGRDSVEIFGLLPFSDVNVDVNLATVFAKEYDDLTELPLYVSLGSILYPVEIRLKGAFRKGTEAMFGGAAKLSLEAFNFYCDLAYIREHPLAGEIAAGSAKGDWFRWCAGLNYAFGFRESRFADSLSLQAEYLRQDDGLTAEEAKTYFNALSAYDRASTNTVVLAAYQQAAQKFNGRFFSLFRDYGNFGFNLSGIAKQHLSYGGSILVNFDDLSFALQNSVTFVPRDICAITFSMTHYGGKKGGEALMMPQSAAYSISFSKSF